MRITGIYAALAALLILILAARVMLLRFKLRVGIGDGGDRQLAKRIRAHANAIEYVPIALILLLLVELNQTQPVIVHGFGITLLVARVSHAIGLSLHSGTSPGRFLGVLLTLIIIAAMATLLLWQTFLR